MSDTSINQHTAGDSSNSGTVNTSTDWKDIVSLVGPEPCESQVYDGLGVIEQPSASKAGSAALEKFCMQIYGISSDETTRIEKIEGIADRLSSAPPTDTVYWFPEGVPRAAVSINTAAAKIKSACKDRKLISESDKSSSRRPPQNQW